MDCLSRPLRDIPSQMDFVIIFLSWVILFKLLFLVLSLPFTAQSKALHSYGEFFKAMIYTANMN